MAPSTESVVPDYCPPTPRRRRIWRLLLIIGAVATALFGLASLAVFILGTRTVLGYQARCLNYSPTTDLIVYCQNVDKSAAEAAQSRQTELGYNMGSGIADFLNSSRGPVGPSAYWVDCEFQYLAHIDLQLFQRGVRHVGMGDEFPLLFMHERATPSGKKYLVVLRGEFYADIPPRFVSGFDVNPIIIKPGGWFTSPQNFSPPMPANATLPGGFIDTDKSPDVVPLEIYAGQIDPADASHFTINFNVRGKSDVVDGWLRENTTGPFVQLGVR